MRTNTTQADLLPQTVKTLLTLRGESLMHACAKASERAQSKVDYGNASSWLRGVPGRMGTNKLEVLLAYLGMRDYRLDAQRIHGWRLPREEDEQGRKAMLQLLQRDAALPARALWLLTPQKAIRGLAVDAGGVTLVFQPSQGIGREELQTWLTTLPQPCVMLDEAVGVKSMPHWEDLLHGREPPERLWQMEQSDNDRAWQAVIETLKTRGIAPEDVLSLVERGERAQEVGRGETEMPT
jgi:hypothetical protein